MKTFYLFALGLVLAWTGDRCAAVPEAMTSRASARVPDGLAKSDWTSIREAYQAGRHAIQAVEGGWQARNPGEQWLTRFDGRGFVLEPLGGDWHWGLELQSYGFQGRERVIGGPPVVQADGHKLTYTWDAAVQEWYVNDGRGLEHGFTVRVRPAENPALNSASTTLHFLLSVRGGLHPAITTGGQGVEFRDASGAAVLNYTGLKVWDADGTTLPAHFSAAEAGVLLLVDEREARYPITVDPIAQQAYLKASNTGADDHFGESVAVSGDTVVVGAAGEDGSGTGVNSADNNGANGAGAAYVFVRIGTGWSQQAYLKASNTGANDQFGGSVAVSGDTIVVGAINEDGSGTGANPMSNEGAANSGAAYVYVRTGTVWSQQAYLKASNTGTDDYFGGSVAVSEDTLVVGAHGEDGSGTGANPVSDEGAAFAGAAYVFVRTGSSWTQQAYLKASNSAANDYFGISAAVSGDTVVVGAFVEDGSGTGPNPADNNGTPEAGAAYVFVRSGQSWSQQAYLKASNTGSGDHFGRSVSVSGDTLIVGAPQEDGSGIGLNPADNNGAESAGAAYVFVRSGTVWSQQAYLKASNTGSLDQFGRSVAASGETIIVGAIGEDGSGSGVNPAENNDMTGAGAAYVFVRSETGWNQQAYLKASNTGADQFGFSVGAAGDTVVVGAFSESGSGIGVNPVPDELAPAAGAAYAFAGFGPAPQIVVEESGAVIAEGGTKSFGAMNVGTSGNIYFTIRNTGTAPLTSLAVSRDGANPGDFAVSALSSTSVPVGPGAVTFTVTFMPSASGTRSAVLHITSNDPDEGSFDITLIGTGLVPEIVVEHPVGTNLVDSAATLGFGSINLGYSVPLAVTIRNAGTGLLSGLAISKNGSHAGDFTVAGFAVTALAPGASTAFTVTFSPAATGLRSAAIHIASDDADENPFDIHLTGTGLAPEIAVEQPAGTGLTDGTGMVNFGSTNLSAGVALSFTIRNTGADPLTGLAVTKDGDHAADFSVSPLGITALAAGASRNFTVTFKPSATGTRIATLRIASNDADENPFDINLTGTGTAPEITVEQPAGSSLEDGSGVRNFGGVYLGAAAPLVFTIRNSGTGPLGGLAVTKDGSHAGDFTVGAPGLTSLAPGASTTFTVTFSPTAAGARSVALHIASDDADENPFDIDLAGAGLYAEIAVEQPSGSALLDGTATVSFGSVNAGSSAPLTFTIRNTGTDPLTGLAITKDGSDAGDFVVGSFSNTGLAAGSSRSFTVTFTPSSAGTRTAAIHIASNDADENPFDIVLTGTGIAPEISVEQPAGTSLVDGVGAADFSTVNLPWNAVRTFTIRNAGLAPLSGLSVSKTGTHAAEFSVSSLSSSALAAGATRTFNVTFTPAAVGTRTAVIRIASNDADENPFDIDLTGQGRLAPEIVVEQPAGSELTDGGAVPVNFGAVATATSQSRVFTIRNTGSATLTGIGAALSGGTAPGDYAIWELGATQLAPGTATTLTVYFLPGGTDVRTTTLFIASNDDDENPFEIALTGTRATPQLNAWRQTYFGSTANSGAGADLSDPDRDGVVNLMEFAAGTGPWVANAQPGEVVKNGSSLEFIWPRRKAALGEIGYAVEWSDAPAGPWTADGVNTSVLTDGSVMQVMKSTLPAGGSGRRFVRLRVTRL